MLFIIVKHYKFLSERGIYKCTQVIIIITQELCMCVCVCVCVRCMYTRIHISACVHTCVTERGGGGDGCVCVCGV